MEKETVVLGLINTMSGEHLVIRRLKNNSYELPGGKVAVSELPKDAIVRETFELTGLRFASEDFEIINVQQRTVDGKEQTVHAFGCKKLISDVAPIFSVNERIKPMFMEPSMFFNLTSNQEFYINLFPQE